MEELIQAIKMGDQANMLTLVKQAANLNLADAASGFTALKFAIEFDNLEAIESLLLNGADPNAPTYGLTPLGQAVDSYCLEAQDEYGSADPKIINLLLAYGADTNQKGTDGTSAADVAKFYGLEEVLNMLRLKN